MSVGQQTVVSLMPGNVFTDRYPRNKAYRLGVTQIACGFLTVYLIIMIFICTDLERFWGFYISLWSGPFFIFAGILGVVSGRVATHVCSIVAFLVMNIIASITAGILMSTSVPSILMALANNANIWLINSVILLIVSMVEGVVALISANMAARVVCMCSGQEYWDSRTVYQLMGQLPTQTGSRGSRPDLFPEVITLPYSPNVVYSVPPDSFIVRGEEPSMPADTLVPCFPSEARCSDFIPPPPYVY